MVRCKLVTIDETPLRFDSCLKGGHSFSVTFPTPLFHCVAQKGFLLPIQKKTERKKKAQCGMLLEAISQSGLFSSNSCCCIDHLLPLTTCIFHQPHFLEGGFFFPPHKVVSPQGSCFFFFSPSTDSLFNPSISS